MGERQLAACSTAACLLSSCCVKGHRCPSRLAVAALARRPAELDAAAGLQLLGRLAHALAAAPFVLAADPSHLLKLGRFCGPFLVVHSNGMTSEPHTLAVCLSSKLHLLLQRPFATTGTWSLADLAVCLPPPWYCSHASGAASA